MKNKLNINNNLHAVLAAVLIIILFIYNHNYLALAALIIFIVLSLYYIKEAKDKKQKQDNYIKNLSKDMSLAAEDTLLKLPFPLLIVNDEGEIYWFNNLLNNIFEKQVTLGSSLNAFVKSVNVEEIFKRKKRSISRYNNK